MSDSKEVKTDETGTSVHGFVIHPSRLAQMKKGFPPEECPKCLAGDADCEICDRTGVFIQRVDADWQPPKLKPGEWLEAYLDTDEWGYVGVMNKRGDFTETAFPFESTGFATAKHMQTLGFKVEW